MMKEAYIDHMSHLTAIEKDYVKNVMHNYHTCMNGINFLKPLNLDAYSDELNVSADEGKNNRFVISMVGFDDSFARSEFLSNLL